MNTTKPGEIRGLTGFQMEIKHMDNLPVAVTDVTPDQQALSNIPHQLRARPQWVVWRAVKRDGKVTKPPFTSRDPALPANVNDPSTWGTFDSAVAAVSTGLADGIGFVFTEQDDFVGIDIDDEAKVAPEHLDQRRKLVDKLLAETQTYTEVSPSGTGLHLIGRGKLPPGVTGKKSNSAQVEIYDKRRFFTVTGNVYDCRCTITDAQELVDALIHTLSGPSQTHSNDASVLDAPEFRRTDLDDTEVLVKAAADTSFLPRYRAQKGCNPGEWSETFMAVVGRLDEVTGSVEQVRRLVMLSPMVTAAPASASGELRSAKAQRNFDRVLAQVRPRNTTFLKMVDHGKRTWERIEAHKMAAREETTGTTGESLILSSGRFVEGFVPPDYLIDGMIQSGFLYSLTGQTGSGKTAVALLIAAHVARGEMLAGREVAKGGVLYFAGENPDDVRMRWIGLCHRFGVTPANMDVHFIPGVFSIAELGDRVAKEVEALGGISLLVVDTTAAYFTGDDENGNKQMGDYARLLRTLTRMSGNPAVIAASHPVKGAQSDNLVPRGGSAFLNEVDGNLSLAKRGDRTSELHWQGKFRGPEFDPIMFGMQTVHVPTLVDSRGRSIPTVNANVMDEAGVEDRQKKAENNDRAMMIAIRTDGNRSLPELAEALGWIKKDGKPDKSRAQRSTDRLKVEKLIEHRLGTWILTAKGKGMK